ncbi:hypothetical protein FB561_6767 [Kribbella amoyensis]|uniref:YrhK-like protein n=1 Tax=Kribbella amoyensis TaxID=996641 RepID=A0A561B955_9ACTN|nr:hypothetical protein [Kribbella amoyensis]TWD75329.1 hypothetical protein FB561_6767 [Kribbella amoyensis]
MTQYPLPPPGSAAVERRSAGPFLTRVTYVRPDGSRVRWSSRAHRKHASLLSRARADGDHLLWAPHRASWWIAILFAIGSLCFVVAPLPFFLELVGGDADGMVFFVGSVFFTTAAALQWLETVNADRGPVGHRTRRFRLVRWEPRRIDWWSSGIQLIGTVYFNVTTFRALSTALDSSSYDPLVWRPDAVGSVCFLVAGYLAFVEVAGGLRRLPAWTLEGAIVSVNFFGCVAFGVSALAAYVLPSTGALADATVANAATSIGALAFLVGSVLLLPEGVQTQPGQ